MVWTHDLRRGHAKVQVLFLRYAGQWLARVQWQGMQKCGCSLATILAAGQWMSSAFLRYLEAELEQVSWPLVIPFISHVRFVGLGVGGKLRQRRRGVDRLITIIQPALVACTHR